MKHTSNRKYDGPVFIVGMNGSGTTMMLDHLGQHPDLYAYPVETYILPHYLQSADRYGDLQRDENFRRMWNDIRTSYVFRWRNAGNPVELAADWRTMPRNAAAIFDRILCKFAAKDGKSRWAEKTPMHVLHIALLAEAFEGSTFIHMIRDGRDCAASDHRRWGRHPVGTIYMWTRAVAEGRRQGLMIGDRYMELRYEEVTESPEFYLRQACEFAGLTFDPRVCRIEKAHRHIKGAATQTIVRNRDRNAGYFSARRMLTLERVAGSRLAEFGYTTQFGDSAEVPSALSRAWWLIHDGARVAARQLRMKLTRNKRMTWPLMWRRWRDIIHSKISNTRVGRR